MKTKKNASVKNEVLKVANGLVAKTMTWKAVAASINTVETIEDKEAWKALCMLGIHAQQGKVTAKDLQDAWSARLKEPENKDGYRYPKIVRSMPYKVIVDGKQFTLCQKVKGEYKSVKFKDLCRVCKAEEVRKDSTDVRLTVSVVAKGLFQSVFVDDTLRELTESKHERFSLRKGYINVSTKTQPKWVSVEIDDNGNWNLKSKK